MLNLERVFTGALALLCAAYLFFTFQMKIGSVTEPGPGFVPAILGTVGLIVALLLFISNIKNPTTEKSEDVTKEGLWRLLGYLITTIAFIPMFKVLGTIIAIFVLVISLTKISGAKGWVSPILLAVICSAIVYSVFYLALDVPLPRGIL